MANENGMESTFWLFFSRDLPYVCGCEIYHDVNDARNVWAEPTISLLFES
jgi:hypothetical protein